MGPDDTIKMTITGAGAVNVNADVHGYVPQMARASAGATYVPLDTARIIANQIVAANGAASFPAVGTGGIPASGVAYVAPVHPSRTARPATSNINYRPSAFISNLVIAAPGGDGKITISDQGAAALTVYADVAGYDTGAARGTATMPLTPALLVNNVSVAAGATSKVTVAGVGGVPAQGVAGAAVNLTARSTAAGALRVYPSGQTSIPGCRIVTASVARAA